MLRGRNGFDACGAVPGRVLGNGPEGMKCDSAGHAEVVAFYSEVGSHGRGAEGLDVSTCVPPNSHSSCYRDNRL